MVGCGSRFVRDPVRRRQAGLGATRLCERTDQSSREPRNELPRARASLLCFSSLSVPSSSTSPPSLSLSRALSLSVLLTASLPFCLVSSPPHDPLLRAAGVSLRVFPTFCPIAHRTPLAPSRPSTRSARTVRLRSTRENTPGPRCVLSHLPLPPSQSRTSPTSCSSSRSRPRRTTYDAAGRPSRSAERVRAGSGAPRHLVRAARDHRIRPPRVSPARRSGRALNRRRSPA